MNLLQKIARLFTAPVQANQSIYHYTVRCNRCGEQITGRVNLRADISPEYNDSGNPTYFYCRKVLIGGNRCFQQIEVNFKFGPDYKLQDREITGGQFVDSTEA